LFSFKFPTKNATKVFTLLPTTVNTLFGDKIRLVAKTFNTQKKEKTAVFMIFTQISRFLRLLKIQKAFFTFGSRFLRYSYDRQIERWTDRLEIFISRYHAYISTALDALISRE